MCILMRCSREFSPTLVVKGGLDQHIRLLESILPSWVNPFTRGEDESVSGMVVGVVHSACRVNLSHLDSRALHLVFTSDYPFFTQGWRVSNHAYLLGASQQETPPGRSPSLLSDHLDVAKHQ